MAPKFILNTQYTLYHICNFVEDTFSLYLSTGLPGTWHEILTTEQSEKVDTMIQQLKGSGLDIVMT
jgi:hypothetical protein